MKKSSKRAVAKSPKPSLPTPRKGAVLLVVDGETADQAGERTGAQIVAPELAACRVIVAAEGKTVFGETIDVPGMLAALRTQGQAVNSGDMSRVEAMLLSQATALQTLSARLIERSVAQDMLAQYETHMRLALKAQAQSRATLETLANVRNGPVIYARQANVASGAPMQVNNGPDPGLRSSSPPSLNSCPSQSVDIASPEERAEPTHEPLPSTKRLSRSQTPKPGKGNN